MARYIEAGDTIDFVASANVTAGGVVVIGNSIVGVAPRDVASGGTGAVTINGVFEMPKDSAANLSVGASVYWNATSGTITTVASGSVACGKVIKAAGSGTLTALVKINN